MEDILNISLIPELTLRSRVIPLLYDLFVYDDQQDSVQVMIAYIHLVCTRPWQSGVTDFI